MATPIFHLSLPVADLARTRAFYCESLGAEVGRVTESWIDLWVFGAQMTFHQRPESVAPTPFRQAQHFGATIEWQAWLALRHRLEGQDPRLTERAKIDEEAGVAKLILTDPDGYLIEVKAYRERSALRPPRPDS